MNGLSILALVLIVIGSIINFILPAIIRKNSAHSDSVQNLIYTVKSIGLAIVVFGCIIFFWLGGKFSV